MHGHFFKEVMVISAILYFNPYIYLIIMGYHHYIINQIYTLFTFTKKQIIKMLLYFNIYCSRAGLLKEMGNPFFAIYKQISFSISNAIYFYSFV